MNTRLPVHGRCVAWPPSATRCMLLIFLVGGIPATPLSGQDPAPPLTIGALYRAVDSLNPRIGAAKWASDAAQARVSGTRRLPDPRLEVATMNRMLPGFELSGPMSMNQVQLSQMFPIPGTGKLGLAGDVAQSRADARHAAVDESSWGERGRAARAFYDLYQAGGTLEVMRETQALLEALATTVNAMYAVGEAKQADVLRAQLEVGRMTGQIADMTALRQTMTARLNAVLNRQPDTPTGRPVLPEFPETLPPGDSLAALALTSRGMLLAGADEVRAATAAETLARREIWPDLELGVTYAWQPIDGGTNNMLSIMLGASLPIWAGSRQLKWRDETVAMRKMAEDDLEAMRSDTRGEVAELLAEFRRARELRTLYAGTLLPQAAATVASARAAYRVGSVDFMTYLDAIMTVYAYRATIYRLESEEGVALADLERVTGQPLLVHDTSATPSPGGSR